MIDQIGSLHAKVRSAFAEAVAEIVDKSRDLIGPVLGTETANRLIESVFAIDTIQDIRTFRPLLQRV